MVWTSRKWRRSMSGGAMACFLGGEVDERRVDRGGPGDQEHQVHPYGAACFLSGTGGRQTICSVLQPFRGTKGNGATVTCQNLTSRRGRIGISSLRRRRWTSCPEKRRGSCTGPHLRKTDFEKARIHRQVPWLFRDFARSQHSAAFAAVQRADGKASREGTFAS